jgi:NADPH:quinone reductase-like Zn-dependent oxidoreductase
MSLQSLAFWIASPGRGELRTETLPAVAPGEVRIRALYSGVSRGTESLVFGGHVPPGEYTRMRAPFQAGQFPAPLKYGYASVGQVEEGPSAEQLGQVVFCLHPHQQHYVVPAAAVYPVPADVPAGRAILAANLETALNGVWDSGVGPGDRVCVVGAGSVGCLTAWLIGRIPGCEVELVDLNPHRRDVAARLGVRFAHPDSVHEGADVVLHASGTSEGLALSMRVAAFEATVVELSWYGDRAVTVPLGQAFHSQRLTLKSSQVGSIADSRRARWSHSRRLQLALSLLAAPELDALINSECRFEDLPRVMGELSRSAGDVIMHRVSYEV